MARLRGTNVLNTTVRGHQHEDGYVAVGADGYTVANSSFMPDTLVFSWKRTAAGLWTCTLKEAYPCNLNYFNVVPVLYTSSTPSAMLFTQLGDNVGVSGVTATPSAGGNTIHFKFSDATSSPGTAVDLPANAGFRYEIGLQLSTAYYVKVY